MHPLLCQKVCKRPSQIVEVSRRFANFTPFNKYSQTSSLSAESDPSLDSSTDHLLDNVLLVRKTPKYDRLKDSELIEHPYIRDILLKNWIDATNTHFEMCAAFEEVLMKRANRVHVS